MKVGHPITRFALMRHAETEWNREKRIQGQQDAPLTSEGLQQAEQWGHSLSKHQLTHVVSSDLGRATLTARIVNRKLELPRTVEPRLREQHWGMWSTRKSSEIESDRLAEQLRMGWHFRPTGGESRLEVLERSWQALVDLAQALNGSRILVITHGGVIRCLLYRLAGRKFLPEEPYLIKPYRLHWLYCDGEALYIERLNDQI